MRVTDMMQTYNTLRHINLASTRLFRAQEQAASGLRFTTPSQDPSGAVRAASLRASISEIENYIANADIADARLRLSETSVAHIGDALQEARTIALSGINSGLDQATLESLANQVDQISQDIMRSANATYGARYLFAGNKLLSPPLVANGAGPPPVLYQGDQGDATLQTGRGVVAVSNMNAAGLLNMAGAADPALDDVFTTLDSLSTALRAGNADGIGAAMKSVEMHFARVTGMRGEIGARLQRLTFDRNRLKETRDVCKVLLGEVEGADLTEVVTQLKQEEVAYQAAVAASAVVGRASLLDYIR